MKKIFALLFCSFIYAQDSNVELCVAFGCEDCGDCSSSYSVYVLNAKPAEKTPSWNLKDSVSCVCGSWSKPSYSITGLPGKAFPFLSFSSCSHLGSAGLRTISMPQPPAMDLKASVGKQIFFANEIEQKKEVQAMYGKKMDLYWKTRFQCQGNRLDDTTLTYRINAIIIGECPKEFLKN